MINNAHTEQQARREDLVLVQRMLKDEGLKVALPRDTYEFAMSNNKITDLEGLPLPGYEPMGASGVLGHISDAARQKYIDYCPEMKMFYPSLHSPSCFGAEPNILECFKYLCTAGGLKCHKFDSRTVSFQPHDPKGQKTVTITVSSKSGKKE